MALLFMDSFDHYANADLGEKWSTITDSGSIGESTTRIVAAIGRRASQGLRLQTTGGAGNSETGSVSVTLTPGDATCIVGLALNQATAFSGYEVGTTEGNASNVIVSVRQGATTQVWFRLNADGTISALRATTVLGTTTAVLVVNTYSYLEFKVTINDTTGVVQIRNNGVLVLDLSAQDTANGAAGWNNIRLGTVGQASGTVQRYYDDLYVLDGTGSAPLNTVLGDVRVDARYPTAEGASSAWTPLSGTDNALMVDETAPDDDTTYVSTSTTGATDTHVTQDAPVAGAAIYGVQHCLNMKKADAGPCTVAPVVRYSTTDYTGSDLSPSTSYAYGLVVQETNPGTGVQWTDTDFNASEFGYKKTG